MQERGADRAVVRLEEATPEGIARSAYRFIVLSRTGGWVLSLFLLAMAGLGAVKHGSLGVFPGALVVLALILATASIQKRLAPSAREVQSGLSFLGHWWLPIRTHAIIADHHTVEIRQNPIPSSRVPKWELVVLCDRGPVVVRWAHAPHRGRLEQARKKLKTLVKASFNGDST